MAICLTKRARSYNYKGIQKGTFSVRGRCYFTTVGCLIGSIMNQNVPFGPLRHIRHKRYLCRLWCTFLRTSLYPGLVRPWRGTRPWFSHRWGGHLSQLRFFRLRRNLSVRLSSSSRSRILYPSGAPVSLGPSGLYPSGYRLRLGLLTYVYLRVGTRVLFFFQERVGF